MWVDNFVSRCVWTILIMFAHIYRTVVKEHTLVGAEAIVEWGKSHEELEPDYLTFDYSTPVYMSFSAVPSDDEFDDYGVPTDSVFGYLGGVREAIRYSWKRNDEGWRIAQCKLIYASSVDSI